MKNFRPMIPRIRKELKSIPLDDLFPQKKEEHLSGSELANKKSTTEKKTEPQEKQASSDKPDSDT